MSKAVGLGSASNSTHDSPCWSHDVLDVTVAFVLSWLAFYYFIQIVDTFNHHWFAEESIADLPYWISLAYKFCITMYFFGSVLPFTVFLIWMSRDRDTPLGRGKTPFVTIIIPAFNEEDNIGRSVAAAIDQDYPAYEIIVLDDGSADHTPYLLESADVPTIRLRSNHGKAQCLNVGIKRAKGDVLVFSDGDSALEPDALRRLVGHMADPTVGAVAGRLMVFGGRGRMLQRWQRAEYTYGQAVIKAAQVSGGSSVLICPGPVCAFRRDLLLRLGGFKCDTVVEDFDATLEVIRAGYRVAYEPRAIARTAAPATWKALHRQRLRWARGNIQVLRKHRDLLFSAGRRRIGLIWLPYCLMLSVVCPLFDLIVIISLPMLLFASHSSAALLKAGLIVVVLMELINIAQHCVAALLDRSLRANLAVAIASMRVFNLFLSFTRLCAIVQEVRGTRSVW